MTRLTLACGIVAALLAGAVLAQPFPSKPIRLVVPSQAGGPPDFVGRTVAARMSEHLGQQIVVENRGGGGGILAAEQVANAPADGYTLLLGSTASMSIAPSLYPKIAYHPTRSFAPVSLITIGPFVVAVNAAFPAQTLQELILAARARPGTINFGSSGNATPLHIIGEIFSRLTGAQLVHVPYKGPPAAVTALLAGEVQVMFDLYPSFPQHVASGRLRILAVTSPSRFSRLPNVPTAIESGLVNFDFSGWTGLIAPAGTPAEAMRRLNAALGIALAPGPVRDTLVAGGLEVQHTSTEEAAAFVGREASRWAEAVRVSGARVD